MPSPDSLTFDNDEFVDVVFGKSPKGGHDHKDGSKKAPKDKSFYEHSVETVSAPWSYPIAASADALRRLYPKHSLQTTRDSSLNILSLPGVAVEPLEKTPLITSLFFAPLSKRLAGVPGVLIDKVELGGFNISWQGLDFIVYIIQAPIGFGVVTQTYILHEGPEDRIRILLLSAGAYNHELHNEIWVYDQGYWQKDSALWAEVQKADWKDVILKDEFKKALHKDVYGFFKSEKIYKELAIPWKRGLIFYGPPGNGKTISIKAIIKTCDEQGFTPLYVKTFTNWAGDEQAMNDVFNKARQLAPCVIILEDLDSLITDRNRSFFLNQVDGLSGNDGLLLIGTTNHFDRLDPGLSTRPSRFDRKYKFDDPDLEERKLYVQYWQKKLSGNEEIDFPDKMVDEIAEITDRFSFAYLKEAFVSTLVTLAGWEGEKPSFRSLLKQEIHKLSKQLDKQVIENSENSVQQFTPNTAPTRPPRPSSATERDIRAVLDSLAESTPSNRVYHTGNGTSRILEQELRNTQDVNALLHALSDLRTSEEAASFRHYETRGFSGRLADEDDPSASWNYSSNADGSPRNLMNRMSSTQRERDMRLAGLQNMTMRSSNASSSRRHFDLGGGPRWEGLGRPSPATGTFPVRYHPSPNEPSASDLA
ncbi:ATP-dependent Zn protease [Coprinopsis cinerea okayama7|uniref:ATP-dependent Zn protease n=1 Tax=Coprinopsis cinerea (strain Okayama-7 / 130 / ATCC MYA-4618 / FGSC 9003) TaxID=240176 RepID=A8NYM1_COPC7|nr:ATP-dependent Zn protease [Coprinopsis cinerea okayama7\|eukprot:XP_001837465.2 ATP-dependent Zn protease [Coprinopsis cinerea okayama7\